MELNNERLTANVYIAEAPEPEDDGSNYWADGALATIEVETTDQDEVRLAVKLDIAMSDDVTVYLTRTDAQRLAVRLCAASVIPVEIPSAS